MEIDSRSASGQSQKVYFRLQKDEDGYPPDDYESLWAEKTAGDLYVVDNIPFFVRDISPGDVIRVSESGGRIFFESVTKPALNSVVRIIAYDESNIPALRSKLEELGCESELSHIPNLIAVEVPESVDLDIVLSFLDEGESSDKWEYETASLRT